MPNPHACYCVWASGCFEGDACGQDLVSKRNDNLDRVHSAGSSWQLNAAVALEVQHVDWQCEERMQVGEGKGSKERCNEGCIKVAEINSMVTIAFLLYGTVDTVIHCIIRSTKGYFSFVIPSVYHAYIKVNST